MERIEDEKNSDPSPPEKIIRVPWRVLGMLFGLIVVVGGGSFAVLTTRAKSHAELIQCANNLCSIGLSARMYALDNSNVFASNIVVMSNELSTPKILMCPQDKRPAPRSFTLLVTQDVYLAASLASNETNPGIALFRCPIHGHVVYGDGRIVRGDGTIQYGKHL